MSLVDRVAKRLKSTWFRIFALYPIAVLFWELLWNRGQLHLQAWFLPLSAWGFAQYWLVGHYRLGIGGGGPGMNTPPERLVTTGPFAYCRNPMYLGLLVFMTGLALSLQSWPALAITAVMAVWFHRRILRDEERLKERFGQPYLDYIARVKRWIPALF